jgi:diguanylate cyclase (GGDEF)-like protein
VTQVSTSSDPTLSAFTERLNRLVEKWAEELPLGLRSEFRRDFVPLGAEHDQAFNLIETIWRREHRSYDFDESTGLARRRPFHTHLRTLVSQPPTRGTVAIGVLFIDLNDFKSINDTHGHVEGDRALSTTSAIIREALRTDQHADVVTRVTMEDDHSVARLGGDEFLVALELKAPADIDVVALRLKRRIDDPERQRHHGYHAATRITCAIGGVVYELPTAPTTVASALLAQELIRVADEFMYRSKEDGRVHLVDARLSDGLKADRERARAIV